MVESVVVFIVQNLQSTKKTRPSNKKQRVWFLNMGKKGLEPPRIAPLVPKTSASTIPPLAHLRLILLL